MMDESNEVPTDPSLERRTRRRFSGADKQRLIAEFDGLGRGEKGPWLRRNGLYASQLANWPTGKLAQDPGRGRHDRIGTGPRGPETEGRP
ncbi:hypothetical protein [Arhodomonas sp. AD133]|uniref:hypothetical protein n=1 Tax=Arhodomonas sp. AD133 TaxID=3415009 RepID=UPI003EBE147F